MVQYMAIKVQLHMFLHIGFTRDCNCHGKHGCHVKGLHGTHNMYWLLV